MMIKVGLFGGIIFSNKLLITTRTLGDARVSKIENGGFSSHLGFQYFRMIYIMTSMIWGTPNYIYIYIYVESYIVEFVCARNNFGVYTRECGNGSSTEVEKETNMGLNLKIVLDFERTWGCDLDISADLKSINQSIDRSINQSTNQSTHLPTYLPIYISIYFSIHILYCRRCRCISTKFPYTFTYLE